MTATFAALRRPICCIADVGDDTNSPWPRISAGPLGNRWQWKACRGQVLQQGQVRTLPRWTTGRRSVPRARRGMVGSSTCPRHAFHCHRLPQRPGGNPRPWRIWYRRQRPAMQQDWPTQCCECRGHRNFVMSIRKRRRSAHSSLVFRGWRSRIAIFSSESWNHECSGPNALGMLRGYSRIAHSPSAAGFGWPV